MFKGFLVLGLFVFLGAASASPRPMDCRETEVTINEVPFPRSNQIQVAWSTVNGVWNTDNYVFELGKVVKQGSKRFIGVNMLDPVTGEVVKSGGVAIRNDGMRASGIVTDMRSKVDGAKADDTFVIFRAFKEQDAEGRLTERNLFVVTIRTLREKIKVCDETHHELIRQFLFHSSGS
jgi:hypothetical protein